MPERLPGAVEKAYTYSCALLTQTIAFSKTSAETNTYSRGTTIA
jgi:hypothetical protein